jgi:hypothetical protein
MPAKPATLAEVFLRTRRLRTQRATSMNRFLLALFVVVLCTPVLAQEHNNRAIVETAYASFALGDYSGTYKATGRSVEAPFAHVWQLVDGKVVSFHTYTDGPPWKRAVSPTPDD